jgi:membrane-associated protein
MVETNLVDLCLAWLSSYGPLVLGLVALLGSLGLPMPTPLLVLAAGALVRQGLLDWQWIVFSFVAGSMLGESAL